MIELFSDTDRTLYYEGCRYQEITPEETRALPEDKEFSKIEQQMGISKVKHDRPAVGRPTVFFGKSNKQSRREGRMMSKNYSVD